MTRLWRFLIGLLAAFGILAGMAGAVFAQSPPAGDIMAEANLLYERGEYAEAVQRYETLIGLGYRDAAVHYNLGNAYLESGDLGTGHPQLPAGRGAVPPRLGHYRQFGTGAQPDGGPATGGGRFSGRQRGRLRAALGNHHGEFGVAALLLWAVAGIAVSVLIVRPAIRGRAVLRGGAVIALVAMLFPLVLVLSMLYSNPYENTGVVTARTVEVLSGPGTQYGEEFALHSGAQVRLVDSRHGWLQVALPGGELRGWLPSYALEAVGRDGGR